MFVKYEKTFHVFPVTSKYNLDNNCLKHLFNGEAIIEEKMDGSNVGIIRHKKGFSLQRRNGLVGASEHEQFDYFNNWAHGVAFERIMSLPIGVILYGELLYAVHTVEYDSLPEYFLAFDTRLNGNWMDYDKRKALCEKHGFHMVPLVARGTFTKNDLPKLMPDKSAYGKIAEGMVIKRYAKHGYFKGKIVKEWFIKTLEESDHWSQYNCRRNGLAIGNKREIYG